MEEQIRVIELFAGTRSIGKQAKRLGMEVLSVDLEPLEGIDIVGDIMMIPDGVFKKFKPHVIWASPPCTSFSVAAMGKNWVNGSNPPFPKTSKAALGMALVMKTIEIIKMCKPMVWYIENPVGMMGKMPFMEKLPIRHKVTYCQYGDPRRMKPTHIWTNNHMWEPRPPCKNGDNCHEAAPRGSRTGTQGMKNARERGTIPEELCFEVMSSAKEFAEFQLMLDQE